MEVADTQQLMEYLKMTYGPGAAVIGVFIARGLWKLVPAMFEMVVEMRLLRKELEEVKKYGPRLDKVEADVGHAHAKLRTLTKGEV